MLLNRPAIRRRQEAEKQLAVAPAAIKPPKEEKADTAPSRKRKSNKAGTTHTSSTKTRAKKKDK